VTKTKVATLAELEDGGSRKVDLHGRPIVLVRIGDTVYCLDDTCSHAEASLSEGEVYAEDCEVECPLHGATFSLVDGEPQCLPATEPVAVHTVTVTDGDVWVEAAG
jgi:3-phenylpropionate/trans-cinnamate dioxygenase ferredoxin subunit